MTTKDMNYLQRTVFNALQNSTNIADQAESYARNIDQYIDLLKLDPANRKLVAEELGATEEQFSGFLTIVKAISNDGKCDSEFSQVGDYMSDVTRKFIERYEHKKEEPAQKKVTKIEKFVGGVNVSTKDF